MSMPDVLDTEQVVYHIIVGGVAKAGMLVLLGLGFQWNQQAFPGQLETSHEAQASKDLFDGLGGYGLFKSLAVVAGVRSPIRDEAFQVVN